MSEALDQVIAYHLRTKHQPQPWLAVAKNGLGNQPDPFEAMREPTNQPGAIGFINAGRPSASALNMKSLSTLFFESLLFPGRRASPAPNGICAKSIQRQPASTEGYLIAGRWKDWKARLACTLEPLEHALELLLQ